MLIILRHSITNGSSNNNSLADQQIRPSPNTFRPSEHVQIDNPDLTEAERSALCDLIDRYSDVFVGPDGALGSCDVIRHKNRAYRQHAYSAKAL